MEPIRGFRLTLLGPPPSVTWSFVPPLLLRVWRFFWFWRKLGRRRHNVRLVLGIATHLEGALLGLISKVLPAGHGVCFVVHDPVPHRWFFPRALRLVERRLIRVAWKLFDTLVVHTDVGRSTLIDGGIEVAKVRMIELPAPISFRRPTERRRGVALVGSLRPDKDYVGVVTAYQTLPARLRSVHPLRVLGERSPGFDVDELRRVIDLDPHGIDLEVAFISREEFETALSCARVVVLPYVAATSGSAVATEAIAAGCVPMVPRGGSLTPLIAAGQAVEWPSTLLDRQRALMTALTAEHVPVPSVGSLPTFRDLARMCAGDVVGDSIRP